jgi:hypothetical protein
MAKTTTNPFTQSIRNSYISLTQASGIITSANGLSGISPTSGLYPLFTAGNDGSIIKGIVAASDDVAKTIAFYSSPDGGTNKYLLGTTAVAATAGFNGSTINVDVLNNAYLVGLPIDQTSRQCLPLASGVSLWAGVVTTAVATAKGIHISAYGEDF